ncbi:MAG: hypothetical protein WC996_02250 [Peptostreptococcales bacterium]|nr:hypothetical protein [Candidatus ainarchaeum sp.]
MPLSYYNTKDTVPLSKLKERYITTFVDNLKDFEEEIIQNYNNSNTKLFIENDKAFLIINEFCFIIIYYTKKIKEKIVQCVNGCGIDARKHISK